MVELWPKTECLGVRTGYDNSGVKVAHSIQRLHSEFANCEPLRQQL